MLVLTKEETRAGRLWTPGLTMYYRDRGGDRTLMPGPDRLDHVMPMPGPIVVPATLGAGAGWGAWWARQEARDSQGDPLDGALPDPQRRA